MSIQGLRTRARRLKRQHGLDLVIVDYLQLIDADRRRREGNRVQEVSEITRGLKTLAKELDVPVIALSQLSRAVESRQDKRPQLADLRESGSIEQDADIVLFIYREEYYLERGTEEERARLADAAGKAELLIAKNRHGPTATVHVHFDGPTTRASTTSPGAPCNDRPRAREGTVLAGDPEGMRTNSGRAGRPEHEVPVSLVPLHAGRSRHGSSADGTTERLCPTFAGWEFRKLRQA